MKKNIASVIIFCVFFTFIAALSAYAGDWRTGCFPGSGTTVTLTSEKNATVKLHTYIKTKRHPEGEERGTDVRVTMRDPDTGALIWSGTINTGNSGRTLNLGSDHDAYSISLSHEWTPGCIHGLDENKHCPDYWGLETKKNCAFK